MSAQIIQFVPRPNPSRERQLKQQALEIMSVALLGEAKDLATAMNGGGKCHEAGCTNTGAGCSANGCLLESIPYNGAGIDGMDLGEPA